MIYFVISLLIRYCFAVICRSLKGISPLREWSAPAGTIKTCPCSIRGLANKILAGEVLQGAEAEGYFGRGIRKEVFADGRKNAADRAVDMLLKKLNGEKYHTELLIAKEDRVEPLGPGVGI